MIAFLRKLYNKQLRKRQKLHLLHHLGRPTYIDVDVRLSFPKNISIGKYCRIGRECHLDGDGGLSIGDGSILAPRVVILTSSHNYNQESLLPYNHEEVKKPVKIGRGCWLGWGCIISPGVTIEDGAVVAMGSVVTKDVKKGAIVGGNPAKEIKTRTNSDQLEELIEQEQFFLKGTFEEGLVRKGRNTQLDRGLLRLF